VGKNAITEDSNLAYFSLFDDRKIADCLLNLSCLASSTRRQMKSGKQNKNQCRKTMIKVNKSTMTPLHTRAKRHSLCPNHCYLNLPEDMEEDNPLDIENIKEKQDQDDVLQQSAIRHPECYSRKNFPSVADVLRYTKPGAELNDWKIALPAELIRPTVRWYHQVTGHPGSKRLYEQIRQRYYHRDLRKYIDNFNCDYCQRNKLEGKGYGLLPEREVRSVPFKECAVDLIGPWIVQVNGRPYEFDALTVIDTVTNLVELIRVEDKTSDTIARKYAQCWLSCYPWPQRCIHDPGGEFTGMEFQTLLENCHIRDVCTSAKNPQANAVCKRMHQTVGNVLRTLLHGEPPRNINSAREFVDESLSIAMHAMRAGVHTTLGSSPGSLVFNRDMFLNIPLIADWHAITQRREHLINENLIRENQKRRRFDYLPNQRVLKKCWNPCKLDERTTGPYRILQTHINGTVTIELRPGVSERLNIRRIIPYKE
jgi:hypothetical protein